MNKLLHFTKQGKMLSFLNPWFVFFFFDFMVESSINSLVCLLSHVGFLMFNFLVCFVFSPPCLPIKGLDSLHSVVLVGLTSCR